MLQQQLVNDIAVALDSAFWDGAGTSNTIKGIFKQSGIETGVLDVTDVDSLIAAYTESLNNFVSPTHWVMSPDVWSDLRKIKVGEDDSRYVLDPANATATPVCKSSACPSF